MALCIQINSNSSSSFTTEASSTAIRPNASTKLILIVCNIAAWVEV